MYSLLVGLCGLVNLLLGLWFLTGLVDLVGAGDCFVVWLELLILV